jgi:Ca2+-binding RTX toxin-like protein
MIRVDSNGDDPGGDVKGLVSSLGVVDVFAIGGTTSVLLEDSSDPTSAVVTATPTGFNTGTVGMGGGDNFFGLGGSLSYQGVSSITLNMGDNQSDTINLSLSPGLGGTAFTIDGNQPTAADPPPGDTLNLELTSVAAATLQITGPGSGKITSADHAPVTYCDIESFNATPSPAFDLVLDMNSSGLGGNDGNADLIDAQSGDFNGLKTLELRVDGALVFVGLETQLNSLTILGSTDADTFSVTETADGLPGLVGSAPAGHTNAAFAASGLSPDNFSIHFNGGGGPATDEYQTTFLSPHDVASFNDMVDAANSGVVNVAGAFTMSYASLTPLMFIGAGGSLLVDASDVSDNTTLAIANAGDPADGISQVTGDGSFEPVTFSGFQSLTLHGGDGAQRLDVRSADRFDPDGPRGPAAPLTHIALDGGADGDTYVTQFGRLNGSVQVLDTGESGQDVVKLLGTDAAEAVSLWSGESLIVKYEGPNLNGTGNDVAIETIKIDHEGIELVEVNGGAGGDTIDASAVPAGLHTQLILRGGDGNDQINGGHGDDILLGEAGDDMLVGNAGRDVMIGGTGADRLKGQNGDDLLIAGFTDYDTNDASLLAILAEWTSTRAYKTRMANLMGTGRGADFNHRLNGSAFLKVEGRTATVHDDRATDKLTGGSGRDWFLYNADGGSKDKVTDLKSDEIGTDIDVFPQHLTNITAMTVASPKRPAAIPRTSGAGMHH